MPRPRITPITALELAMRDVLDCMDDFACGFAFDSVPDAFEILAVEPPPSPPEQPQQQVA